MIHECWWCHRRTVTSGKVAKNKLEHNDDEKHQEVMNKSDDNFLAGTNDIKGSNVQFWKWTKKDKT